MTITIQWVLIFVLLVLFIGGCARWKWGWPQLLFIVFLLFALFFATDFGIKMLHWLNEGLASIGHADVTHGGG
jgi:uncharacterized membrane protein YccC